MVRTPVTIQSLNPNGITAALTIVTADTANNHEFTNTGSIALLLVNQDAAVTVTVTIVSVADPILGRIGDIVQAVAPGETMIVGPLSKAGFNQSTGLVNVDVDTTETDFELFAIAV